MPELIQLVTWPSCLSRKEFTLSYAKETGDDYPLNETYFSILEPRSSQQLLQSFDEVLWSLSVHLSEF